VPLVTLMCMFLSFNQLLYGDKTYNGRRHVTVTFELITYLINYYNIALVCTLPRLVCETLLIVFCGHSIIMPTKPHGDVLLVTVNIICPLMYYMNYFIVICAFRQRDRQRQLTQLWGICNNVNKTVR